MRIHDWPEKLHARIQEAKTQAYVLGTHDCALFVCDCIKDMTGIDYFEKYRGTYTTVIGAAKVMRQKANVDNIEELATSWWGEPIPLSQASRGDVIILEHDGIESFGIVVGTHAVFLNENGIIPIVVNKCKAAWKIV